MANSISGNTTFVAGTNILSSPMNTNFTNLTQYSAMWQKYNVAYTDINNASAATTITLYNLDPKESVIACAIKHSTAFAGGSISTITGSVGIAGNNIKHIDNFDVGAAVSAGAFDFVNLNLIESFSATTPIYAVFTAAGANLDSLTAGDLDVWVLKNLLP